MDINKQGGAIFLENNNVSKTKDSEGTEQNKEPFSPDKENVLYCKSCEFVVDRNESNWFPGDSCPECKEEYLSSK